MSQFHFARLFKRATGQSPYQFVLARRMAKAKSLLAQTMLPINEVASRVDYQSQSHFTSCFSKFTGMIASEVSAWAVIRSSQLGVR